MTENAFDQQAVDEYLDTLGEEVVPPPPVPLTFDIVWVDPDQSPTMFIGITGSGIEDGFLTLRADRITHLINTSQIAHVNIWQEHTDE